MIATVRKKLKKIAFDNFWVYSVNEIKKNTKVIDKRSIVAKNLFQF